MATRVVPEKRDRLGKCGEDVFGRSELVIDVVQGRSQRAQGRRECGKGVGSREKSVEEAGVEERKMSGGKGKKGA